MEAQSQELQEYIKSSILSIKNAVDGTGFGIYKPIKFSVAVINTSEAGGGLKIYVANADGKLKSEEISHISFEIEPLSRQDLARQFNRERRSQDSCK